MRVLPPPLANLVPFAKSAPSRSALTKRGISPGVGGAVRVDHGDDVPGRRREAAGQRISLATAGLHDNTDIRAHCAGDGKRIVNGVTIDHDHFVNVRWHAGKDVGQVAGFIRCRDDYGNPRPTHLVTRLNRHTKPLVIVAYTTAGNRESAPGWTNRDTSAAYSCRYG